MVKNGYVNNLSEMREQLRRNYRNPEDVVESSRPVLPETGSAPETISVRSEAARDFRDLEGRLLSALALVESELGRTGFYRTQLTEQRDRLQALLQEMQSPVQDKNEIAFQKRVDVLRYRFFEVALPVSKGEAAPEKEERSSRANAWIVASAILVGSILVALGIFFAF